MRAGAQPPAAWRRAPRIGARLVKGGVAGAMLLLLLASAYTSALIGRKQEAMQAGTGYNVTWLLTQAGLEVSRLRIAVRGAMVPGTATNADEVALRLDIVDSRLDLMTMGEVDEFTASIPAARPLVQLYADTAANVRRVFESGLPDRYSGMDALLAQLHGPMSRLAAMGHGYSGLKSLAEQDALGRLYRTLVGLLCAVSLCGAGLVGILAWQNRLLSQARNRASTQNRILYARDRELNTRNARFDAALTNMSQALCMVDGRGRVIVCNARFLAMFDLPAAEAGTPVADVFRAATLAGRYGAGLLDAIQARQAHHATARTHARFTEADDDGVTLAVSQQPMVGGGWVATIEDITERRRVEERAGFLAHHDALTGLPNRRLFQARLQDALDQRTAPEDAVAVLCLDVDRFKQVNDTLGHAAGDTLLKSVAARLQACVGGSGVVARLSGDEFAILQTAVPQPHEAEALARRILDAVSRPHAVDGHQVPAGASIGIAVLQPGADGVDTLMQRADVAQGRAKADGRGRFRTFDAGMDTAVQQRRLMAADLREALARGEFEVFYQPLFDLAASRVCAFEALLRWRHPERGLVMPGTFVPLAEELGLVVPIGEWVLAKACSEAATWPDNVKVAVNLSAMQVRAPGLVGVVGRTLDAAGLAAARLELEITETVLLHDSGAVLATLRDLGALGVCIVLDDFGTGYSSLGYLKSFRFGKLKIDRSFIEGVAARDDCEAIVRCITGLAQMLGIATTAEGVETPEQLRCLRDIGCTEVQGYLFDVPRPAAEIQRWFTGHPLPASASLASPRPMPDVLAQWGLMR